MSSIRILTFNILAPHYADPKYYPLSSEYYLDTNYRRRYIIEFLRKFKDSYDILSLQEVTDDTPGDNNSIASGEFKYINNELSNEFIGKFFPHDKDYWDHWCKKGEYFLTGNALFFRKRVFRNPKFTNLSLLTGNHAVKGEAYHIPSGKFVRAVALHLDSDSGDNRIIELTSLMNQMPENNNIIDIVAGDFNTSTTLHPIKIILANNHFKDALLEVNDTKPTFPLTLETFVKTGAITDPIDHIIYRSNIIRPDPLLTKVIDNNLWYNYPIISDKDILGPERVNASLQMHGSDHIPVIATFNFIY